MSASADRADIVHKAFRTRVAKGDFPAGRAPATGLDPAIATDIFRAQCQSRALDLESRRMQRAGQGYYTIGSSGHEGMAAVARALRPTDPAFLHYRDGAFQLARSQQVAGQDMIRHMLLSFACARADPISGGRHKVLGSKALMIPPQTSTIASHLPKALGAAFSIGLARRHPPAGKIFEDDALAVCSFGDASANHSTAQGAFNAASWTVRHGSPLPLLFVCEDNGIGISVKTPDGWIAATQSQRPGVRYFHANGLDLYETHQVATEAADYVRRRRRPAFLHLRMVRLYGHAGADVPTSYLTREEVERDESNDPLLHSARLLAEAGALSPEAALSVYDECCAQVSKLAEAVVDEARLETAEEVMESLIPPPRQRLAPATAASARSGEAQKADAAPLTLARAINAALAEVMGDCPEIVLMGEDVGRKGGVYGVTQKLQARFGADRVMDTILDEQSILGLAIGLAHNGFLPIPEIQFLAYLHNAEDQIRGEAATLSFFSNGQFTNPMVLRIAGLGYQRGFGGHFHNDNSIAVLRDIPGVIIACPSRPDDAVMMLRECVRLARDEARVVVFLEPIALYQAKDLSAPGDGLWQAAYPAPEREIRLGEIGLSGEGRDLALVTYGNGHFLCRQAAEVLQAEGVDLRVIDLRWLAPLPEAALLDAVADVAHVLIVDECRRTGGQAEGLMALMAEAHVPSFARLTAQDSFIATGPAFAATLPSLDGILAAARKLMG